MANWVWLSSSLIFFFSALNFFKADSLMVRLPRLSPAKTETNR